LKWWFLWARRAQGRPPTRKKTLGRSFSIFYSACKK